jgi:signal transduction histidine kinase
VKVNQRLQPLDREINLPYHQNNLQIKFGFVTYNNQNIFIRHRLNPEEPWIYSANRSLDLYSLSPGEYMLALQYSTDNTHWRMCSTFPRIIINPPVWQDWRFQTAIALLLIAVVFLYFRTQIAIYRRHQQKLIQSEIETVEQERSRIAKDLHDSVGTDFSAIKMMVSQVLQKHNEPKIEEIEMQFQHTIQEIKTIIYGLTPPGLERYGLIAGLKNYIEKLNGQISMTIELNTFGAEIKDPKLSITIFRIIQELISNSLKHSNAKKISLHVNSFEDLLNIVYEDNGKGFDWDNRKQGLGLFNIETRIQSMNGKLRFDAGAFGISYTIDIPLSRKTPD